MSREPSATGAASSVPQRVFDEAAPLVERRQVGRDIVELTFQAPRIARTAAPGQFVNVLLPSHDFTYKVHDRWPSTSPPRPFLLRRPFGIYRADPDGGRVAILVRLVGEGTRALARLRPSEPVKLLGPLGKGFDLPPDGAAAILVAGGCGWASLGMLARTLAQRGNPTYAFIGAATTDELPVETTERAIDQAHPLAGELPGVCVTAAELEELGITVGLAAEEGGNLYRGLVTGLLERFVETNRVRDAWLFACGPWPMLEKVARLARSRGLRCQVALEEMMACGMGVCNSCVVEVVEPDGSIAHRKLCTDGPVLDAAVVNWNREPH